MTTHVRERLNGIPGVTDNAVQTLVFGWIRSEQAEVLEVLGAKGVCDEVVGAGSGMRAAPSFRTDDRRDAPNMSRAR